MEQRRGIWILTAVAAISAAVLAYEVLLIRLFAIVQWHFFAYMAISIALLGFGASGTFIYLMRDWLRPRFATAFAINAAAFGISGVAGFVLAQRLPFNALEVAWEPSQLLYLLLHYVLFAIPFFAGANCIGLALAHYSKRIGRIYACNLGGSSLGALGLIGLLQLVTAEEALWLIAALGFAAAGLASLSAGQGRLVPAALIATAVLVPLFAPPSWTAPRISPYKGLSMALAAPGARVLEERSGPLGLLTVVDSPQVPFHHAPGLSLNTGAGPPSQLGVFTDGDGMVAITAFSDDLAALDYLDFMTSALPYQLLKTPNVLIIGAGGGSDVLQALRHRAASIDAVELNHQMVGLVAKSHHAFAGNLYARPDVRVHVAEARGFVAGNTATWDLIQIPLLDSFAAAAAGVYGVSESYLYTVEAFGEYLRHLRPGGYLAITRWLKLPPRYSLKLFATAFEALGRAGVTAPERRIALIRGWNSVTLLVRNGDIGASEIAAIRAFAETRSFDLAHFPGMAASEANRANLLSQPYFHQAAQALAGPGRADFLDRYKFDIRPSTDDRPYFFDFFRWRSLPEFLSLRLQSGTALIEWGYPILFATLVQAALLSLLLILLPLWLRRRKDGETPRRWRVMSYFMCLDLAFMFVEIAFIQRFVLFLGHPLYAVAVVLAGFLAFAGIGSGLASRFRAQTLSGPLARLGPIGAAVTAVAIIALFYAVALPTLFAGWISLPEGLRILLSLCLIAPLGLFMGMPFPLGLELVSARWPALVPWAWGISGCFSVIGILLATLLAIHLGFTAVIVIAAVLYLAAGTLLASRRPNAAGRRR